MMDHRTALIPFARVVMQKAWGEGQGKSRQQVTEDAVLSSVESAILDTDDPEIRTEIEKLVRQIREPWWRTMVRPVMTFVLTLAFVGLILYQVVAINNMPSGDKMAEYKELLTIFLAIYGPIVGFWFGERTAERTTSGKP